MGLNGDNRINHQIRSREVRLIDEKGTQIGVKPLGEALRLAQESGLDLVEIYSQDYPPVCKILDYSKFKYEKAKKLKEAKKKHRHGYLKEIRLRPKIGSHDLEMKIKHGSQFLEERYKVRFTIIFFGREKEHQEFGLNISEKIKEQVGKFGILEQDVHMEGNRMILQFAPGTGKTKEEKENA